MSDVTPSPVAGASEGSAQAGVAVATRILVALDASDHANRAVVEAARIAAAAGGSLTGIHVYAAKLHDRRFRQMEGGLPARYREEAELERQREVHDSLITHGLQVIGDSYHDAAQQVCQAGGIAYRRLSPEGKNYRRLVEAAASGEFDLLILGARGLGATPGAMIGSVCERAVRRSPIDALVIRDHRRQLADGPLVVGIDGSPQSFGALRTALALGRRLGAPVHAVAAYDPYFHYVAFRRIADGLSEEAGRVFRFKEQEKLHEEIIDDGLAKIYASHLEVARAVARMEGVEIVTALLDGRPYQVIARYLADTGASLLFVGKTGIHADPDLDIGSNTENLLRVAASHLWIGTATHTPPLDAVARETITWSTEAEQKIARVPESVRAMVHMVILRYAQKHGHTVVTSAVVDEATARFCPGHGGTNGHDARVRPGTSEAAADDAQADIGAPPALPPVWDAAALARLSRLPGMAREAVRRRAAARAREASQACVTLDTVEAAIAQSRQVMQQVMRSGGHRHKPQSND